MSEFDPDSHEEIARRLREEGPATAPPDLARELMRRVRSEPRGSTSSARRPVVTLVAAAAVIVALLAGVSKLGGGSSSSAGSVGGGGVSGLATTGTDQAEASIIESKTLRHVPRSAIFGLKFAAADSLAPASCAGQALSNARQLALAVPYTEWEAATVQLENARRLDPYDVPRVTVRLHRLAPGAKVAGAVITCP
jgi:hypothetical protein